MNANHKGIETETPTNEAAVLASMGSMIQYLIGEARRLGKHQLVHFLEMTYMEMMRLKGIDDLR